MRRTIWSTYDKSMKNYSDKIIGWVKSHPLITSLAVLLVAPGFIFGVLWNVLGFIGWGRVIIALLALGCWGAYKIARQYLDEHMDIVSDAVSLAREIKGDLYK